VLTGRGTLVFISRYLHRAAARGRILFNIVRFMRSERCLELGTAYGMSALFILAALTASAKPGHLATVEGFEPMFSLGSSMLKRRYEEMVSCHFGKTSSVLPELVKSLGRIDFMFHDCGHSREDYIRDFNQLSEILAPGQSSSSMIFAGKTPVHQRRSLHV
jgi:predicted O-methyltransferase YrrM